MPVRTAARPKPDLLSFTPLSVEPTGHKVGYCRVSTEEQIMDLQVRALEAAGCTTIYQEKVSGAAKKRPQLDLAIKELQPGDVFMVWKLDRLARTTLEVFSRVAEIKEAGATFRSLTESIAFDTPMGNLMMTFIAGMAQFERENVICRTKPGMDAARDRGSQIGAPIKFTPAKKAKARGWIKDKVAYAKIAKRLDLSAGTISIWVKRGMPD